MTSANAIPSFHTVSPLKNGARLAVLTVVIASLAAGFLAGLTQPAASDTSQAACAPAACTSRTC